MQSSSPTPSIIQLRALGRARDDDVIPSPQMASAAPPSGADNAARLSLDVRRARFTDLPAIGEIQYVYPLHQPHLSLRGYNAAGSLLSARLPGNSEKPEIMVGVSNGRIVGFVDFKPAMRDNRWILQALGASTGVYDPGPIWEELLRASIRRAGMNGVKRLYAQSTAGSNAYVALQAAGFASYTVSTIYVADSPKTLGAEVSMRPQESSDTWAIHQLYNASVPREVLYAEAFTSHVWDINRSRLPGTPQTTGWVMGDSATINAYVRVTSEGGVHCLEITFPPGSVKQGTSLLDAVLRRLRLEKRISRVYVAIRGYQQEIEPALGRLGFAPGLTQDLLVRYTAIPIQVVRAESAVQSVDLGDRVPSHAPSILTAASRRSEGE